MLTIKYIKEIFSKISCVNPTTTCNVSQPNLFAYLHIGILLDEDRNAMCSCGPEFPMIFFKEDVGDLSRSNKNV